MVTSGTGNGDYIVGEAVAGEREFTDRHAARGMDIGGGCVADEPACRLQQSVEFLRAVASGDIV